jgi:hypothetical protein
LEFFFTAPTSSRAFFVQTLSRTVTKAEPTALVELLPNKPHHDIITGFILASPSFPPKSSSLPSGGDGSRGIEKRKNKKK